MFPSWVQLTAPVLVVVLLRCRLKRPVPRRKYGLLSNYDDSVEMVEGESDEDDTLYEARSLRRSEVTRFLPGFSVQLLKVLESAVADLGSSGHGLNFPSGQISCLTAAL